MNKSTKRGKKTKFTCLHAVQGCRETKRQKKIDKKTNEQIDKKYKKTNEQIDKKRQKDKLTCLHADQGSTET